MFLPLVLNNTNTLLSEKYAAELLQLNNITIQKGLIMTKEEATNVIYVRNTVLNNYGRVDLGIDATKEIIEKFFESSFISKENYIEVINELQEIFYYMKNETEDRISDNDIVLLIKDYFENTCRGSIEFLKSELQEYPRNFRKKEQVREVSEKGDM